MGGKIFVYGTLKKGFYNHTRFGFDKKTKFKGEFKLHGAEMYDLGSYPCVVFGDGVVHGEIYEYLDEDCEKAVRDMEISAGYVEKDVEIEGHKTKIFVYDYAPSKKRLHRGVWQLVK